MILCTQEARSIINGCDVVYKPNHVEKFVEKIASSKPKEVTIYDITNTEEQKHLSKIYVNDHVNRTGSNPLVGKQKYFDIDFIDIKKTYKPHSGGIITFCCGKKLNKELPFPSHYLCHISIICKTLKVQNITGILINFIK
ncbi:MAG: hypothetical protein CBD58_02580 [bacterium TMED198]|nr:MAG: hypothetical protein CBD58_02580 [bacterium TMED198]